MKEYNDSDYSDEDFELSSETTEESNVVTKTSKGKKNTINNSSFNPLNNNQSFTSTSNMSEKKLAKQMDVLSIETKTMYKEHSNILSRGWEMYDLRLSENIITQARNFLKMKKDEVFSETMKHSCTIFQRTFIDSENLQKKDDKKRFQYVFNKNRDLQNQAWFNKFREKLNIFLLQKGRNCVLQECVLLYSEKNCDKQDNHRDYSIFNSHYMAGIFSFDDTSETFLNIEDNDEVKPENKTQNNNYSDQTERIQIPVGQVLLFRGDTIHSGAAYKNKPNLRLYFKSYPNGVVLPETNKKDVNTNLHSEKKQLKRCAKCNKGGFSSLHNMLMHQYSDCPKLTPEEKKQKKEAHREKSRLRKKRQRKMKSEELERSEEELKNIVSPKGSNVQTQQVNTTTRVTRSKSSNINL